MYATRYAIPYALDTARPMRLESRVVYARSDAKTQVPAITEAPGTVTDPEPHQDRQERAQRPFAGAFIRSFACLDCGVPIKSTSPNAQRCPECSKAHTRKLQMAWMRKKRGKA